MRKHSFFRWTTLSLVMLALTISVVAAQLDCPELVSRALQSVETACAGLGRNEACYGNNQLAATLGNTNDFQFTTPSDRVPVGEIRQLQTFGLDERTGTWGVALLNIQANLPETLPGQGVQFILYGEVTLTDSGDPQLGPMQSFYFTTSGLTTRCNEAPPDSLLIRSPEGIRVTLTANGMELDVGSAAVLQAVPGQRMRLATLQGEVRATYDGRTQIIPRGFEASVELGGEDGLTPEDTFDEPYLWENDDWDVLAEAASVIWDEALEIPDTEEWSSWRDYCADPANASICDSLDLRGEPQFATCGEINCPVFEMESDDSQPVPTIVPPSNNGSNNQPDDNTNNNNGGGGDNNSGGGDDSGGGGGDGGGGDGGGGDDGGGGEG